MGVGPALKTTRVDYETKEKKDVDMRVGGMSASANVDPKRAAKPATSGPNSETFESSPATKAAREVVGGKSGSRGI
jgi:hypothetical protein